MDNEEKKLKDFYEPFFSLFPDYYKVFDEFINNVIYKDNDCSFSLKDKLFLGIMGSSTIGCEFLLDDFKRRYAMSFDDQSWVNQGLQCKDIPKRIKNISIINNILAHKPWTMDCRNFTVFENGLSTFLFKSAIILTTAQRFATILNTFKIFIHYDINEEKNKANNEKEENNDQKEENSEKKGESDKDEEKVKDEMEKENKEELEMMKKKKRKSGNLEKHKLIHSINKRIEVKEDEDNKTNTDNKKEIFKKYIYELIVSYSDFNQHAEKYLYLDDFNWENNAKYFFMNLAGKDMEYLEKEFKFLEKMILVNEKKTEAIIKYVMLIFGIRDNDYNYHNNNIFLSVEEKRIIKKIACYPEQIQEFELSTCLSILNKKEFIHLIFIVAATKQKISLNFFAKTFEDFEGEYL